MSQYAIPRASLSSCSEPHPRFGPPKRSLPLGPASKCRCRPETLPLLPGPEVLPTQQSFSWDEPDLVELADGTVGIPLTVTADISESASEVARHLERLCVGVVRTPIAADYMIGDLGIERRTGRELQGLLSDGSLSTQVNILARGCRYRLLICEDLPGPSNVSRELWGKILSVTIPVGLPTLTSRSPEETAQIILSVGRAATVRKPPNRTSHRYKTCCLSKRASLCLLLQGLPNIGSKLAWQLVERFGSAG